MRQLRKITDMEGETVEKVRFDREYTLMAIHFRSGKYVVLYATKFWDRHPLEVFSSSVDDELLRRVRHELGILSEEEEAIHRAEVEKDEARHNNAERMLFESLKRKYGKEEQHD